QYWCELCPNGAKVIVADEHSHKYTMWDLGDLSQPIQAFAVEDDGIEYTHTSLSPDGRWWVLGSETVIRVIDTHTGQKDRKWTGPFRDDQYFTPDSRRLPTSRGGSLCGTV